MKDFTLILTCNADGAIPNDYNLKENMYRIKEMTSAINKADQYNAVIMGKTTYIKVFRENPEMRSGKVIYAISDLGDVEWFNEDTDKGIRITMDVKSALEHINKDSFINKVYVLGGHRIYSQVIDMPELKKVCLTLTQQNITTDKKYDVHEVMDKFPMIKKRLYSTDSDTSGNNIPYTYYDLVKTVSKTALFKKYAPHSAVVLLLPYFIYFIYMNVKE